MKLFRATLSDALARSPLAKKTTMALLTKETIFQIHEVQINYLIVLALLLLILNMTLLAR